MAAAKKSPAKKKAARPAARKPVPAKPARKVVKKQAAAKPKVAKKPVPRPAKPVAKAAKTHASSARPAPRTEPVKPARKATPARAAGRGEPAAAPSALTSAVPITATPVVTPRPVPTPSAQDRAAAHEYLLARSATRSEEAVTVNGKRLPTEGDLLKMPEANYMNEEQLAFFKHRLQEMERELLQNAGETTEHLRETVIVPDPADRATIEEEHALELRTRDRERKLLKKVQQALARIDSGDYGYCEETGEPIGIPRLLARPTATLSLEAQQCREMKQKLYGD